jgi:hypothetical protein
MIPRVCVKCGGNTGATFGEFTLFFGFTFSSVNGVQGVGYFSFSFVFWTWNRVLSHSPRPRNVGGGHEKIRKWNLRDFRPRKWHIYFATAPRSLHTIYVSYLNTVILPILILYVFLRF